MTPQLRLFVAANVEQYRTSPGGLGKQCVDLVELWAIALGAHRISGNAVDLPRFANRAEWTWTDNALTNYPSPGGIVTWGASSGHGIGPNGHTAVCLLADATDLYTFDQDWPIGAPCRVTLHDYRGVAGWLTRRG